MKTLAPRIRRYLPLVALVLVSAGASLDAREPFPAEGLQPKAETGVDRFLSAHPDYDGRGVVVAIFDTGVDPGAPGLQVTSDGKPKIVDLVDGSGSGDVDTSVVRAAKDGAIEGLSGRTLKLGEGLACPSGKWHVGLKPAFEFFPGGLVRRLSKKRRKAWDEAQRIATARLTAAIADLDRRPGTPDKELAEDLRIRKKQLEALQKDYEDPGPVYDCVVFHDGKTWRAVIDTDEDGDLGDEKALAAFREERQYSTFSAEDRLNYGINVYDEGNRLSIVVDCGAHGTHVAGMVAAHVPGKPELDGVAPGAQIVSVKIGDTRMGSNSMGTGEERGLVAVLRNKCDLINMSYGGPGAVPNRAYNDRLYAQIVDKHGVIFVSSAGNEGPALSTVGGPGGTTSALYGVGAYVSPEMMKAQYALRETVPPIEYTWSSRGPTLDGDMGVDFSAPGGAVSPVPNWLLQGATQMNGTSMSSPSLCGSVALLLSGLRARGAAWSPYRVRRALAETAKPVEGIEPFALGRGLIQVPEAFDHLVQWGPDRQAADARFEVTLPDRGDARGVYLRESPDTERPLETRVRVRPLFREDEDHGKRIGLALRVALEATAPWVETGAHLMLHHGGESFRIRVDPTKVAPGTVAFAEIVGRDAEDPDRGALFRLPVTVTRPMAPPLEGGAGWQETLSFRPGGIERRFFAVPAGATWADLRIRGGDHDAPRLLVVQAQQLLPGRTPASGSFEGWFNLAPDAEVVRSFEVTGGRTMELCLAQYWSSLGEGRFDVALTFHGLLPDTQALHLDGAAPLGGVDVTAPVRRERIAPEAKLTALRKRLRPAAAVLRPLGARDTLSENRRIHELVLTYEFELAEDASIQPVAFNLDSEEMTGEEWSSNLWLLFDENKRRVGRGPLFDDQRIKASKGKYVLRQHLRHVDPARLEAVRDAVMHLDVDLEDAISVPVYADPLAGLRGGKGFEARDLERGARVRVYLGAVPAKKLPAWAEGGDELRGTITYGEQDAKRVGAGRRPGGFPLRLLVPPSPKKRDAGNDGDKGAAKEKGEGKPTLASVEEAVRDLRVAKLGALREAGAFDDFDRLAAAILTRHPGHLPVLVEQLKRVDGKGPPYEKPGALAAVLDASGRVVARIDRKRLAAHFGTRVDPDDPKAKALRRRMTARRDALAEALFRKARALAAAGAGRRADFQAALADLRAWVDLDEDRYVPLQVAYERARHRLGAALKLLGSQIEKGPAKRALYEQRAALFEELGWAHWAAHERKGLAIRFPAAYPPF